LENKAGFIDVIWGSILRERTARGINTNDPLRLVRRENGHFAVIDDATSWKIELIGYGKDNVAAFARLID
jgi:putative photosynthetic complex assembly protein